jgi:HSP20 family protein
MALVKWTPNADLSRLQHSMNRLFDSFFGGEGQDGSALLSWAPTVDIAETDDEIRLVADIPGMEQKDINLAVKDNTLILKGERQEENKDEKTNYYRNERIFGSFYRSFSLPSMVDVDKVKAKYKDGVLTITMPKVEEARPKEISIDVT